MFREYKMGKKYKGTYEKQIEKKNSSHDWSALIYWLGSLAISLIPLYIDIIIYFNSQKKIDSKFWTDCFVNGDILWVFSTVLLFALFESLTKKRRKAKDWIKNLSIFGVVFFLIVEVTWIVFYFLPISIDEVWPLYVGVPLIVISMIISTPLKIEFIKIESIKED